MTSRDCEPLALGAILRIDVTGWRGAAPRLPRDPVAVEEDLSTGVKSFAYDLLPGRACLAVGDACDRLSAIVLSLYENWPFDDLPFPPRGRLDLGLVVDDPSTVWSATIPTSLLAALADADIELSLSVYPSGNDEAEGG